MLEVVDVVELELVVVETGWQTETFTVELGATSALAAGFWLSTLPAEAPLAHVESVVVLATRPALEMAACAAPADWPTTPGTSTQLETTMLTELLGCTGVPGDGLCEDTCPLGYCPEQPLVWLPTFRPAWPNVTPADPGLCPSTLGPDTEVWVPDTVS